MSEWPNVCAAVLVLAALRGGKDEAAVLDGAGAHQHVPMRFAGRPGEGGRDRQKNDAPASASAR